MKTRLLFEAATIAGIISIMMTTIAFAAYPGPDSSSSTNPGYGGAWVGAAVTASYGAPTYYSSESYTSTRGSTGGAQVYGNMQYYNFYDSAHSWGTTAGNSITNYESWNCQLAATYTYSQFLISGPIPIVFPWDHYVYVQVS